MGGFHYMGKTPGHVKRGGGGCGSMI